MILSDEPKPLTRFTSDGSAVTEASPLAGDPLILTHDVTLRARTFSPVRAASAETVATFTSTIPQLPDESLVSPAHLTITHASLDGSPAQVSVSGPSGTVTGYPVADWQYLLDYPLSPDAPTPLTLHRNGVPDLTADVLWRAIDLANNDLGGQITIRLGDSLLLTAGDDDPNVTLALEVLDDADEVYAAHSGTAGDTFPILFDRGGVFVAHAALNGVSVGALVVKVIHVDFDGPIACQVGFTREKGVVVYGPADAVVFTAQDPALLEVSVKETTPYGVRLYLRPLGRGTPVLQARLGAADGPILASQAIDVFELSVIGRGGGVIDSETGETTDRIIMTPHISGLDFEFAMFAEYATFADGATTSTTRSSDFVTYTNEAGVTAGAYDLIAIQPEGEASSCYTIRAWQRGDVILWDPVNSTKCKFAIPNPVIIGIGQTGSLQVLVDNPNNKDHLHGNTAPHPIALIRNATGVPANKITATPENDDCRNGTTEFPLNLAVQADALPGAYDVKISNHPFAKRVFVSEILVEIQVNNTPAQDDDYVWQQEITCRARVSWTPPNPEAEYEVLLTSEPSASEGGTVKFLDSIDEDNRHHYSISLTVTLPGNGDWAEFKVIGDRKSTVENDSAIVAAYNDSECCGREDLTVSDLRIQEIPDTDHFKFPVEKVPGTEIRTPLTNWRLDYRVTGSGGTQPVEGAKCTVLEVFPDHSVTYNGFPYRSELSPNDRFTDANPYVVRGDTDAHGYMFREIQGERIRGDDHNMGLPCKPLSTYNTVDGLVLRENCAVAKAIAAGFNGQQDYSASVTFRAKATAKCQGGTAPQITVIYQWTQTRRNGITSMKLLRNGASIYDADIPPEQ